MYLTKIFTLIIITSQYKLFLTTECFSNDKGWCEFRNIETTHEKPLFQPNLGGSQKINRILFSECIIPVLTTEICTSFPDLVRFDIEQVSLVNVNEKSLENCTRLSHVSFFNNKLQTVNREIFKKNSGLRYVSFSWNQLTHIDMSTFAHLYVLEELALDNNRITIIDFRLVGELQRMSVLHLSGNLLIQLNEKTLLKRFPGLKKIYIEDNLLPCDRIGAILEDFRLMNVTVRQGLSYNRMPTHYDRKSIQDIDCLDNQAYSEMLAMRFGTKFEPEVVTVVEKLIQNEENKDSSVCWYIGGGVTVILVLIIMMLGFCYCRKRNREMGNGDYYYDYRTQEKVIRESYF